MASNLDIDQHINNTQSLIDEVGNASSGDIQKILQDYADVNERWNDFLDDQLSGYGVSLPGTSTEQDKIDAIVDRAFYRDQSRFVSALKTQVETRDNARAEIKAQAEAVLAKEKELIEQNKAIIESLRADLQADIEKQQQLEQEIENLNNEIEVNKEKINERKTRMSILEAEIADPAVSDEDKKMKSKELSELRKEVKDLTDKNSDLSGSVKNKTSEKGKIDIATRSTKIKELADKNKELEERLNENLKDLNNVFNRDNITISAPGASRDDVTPADPAAPAQGEAATAARAAAGGTVTPTAQSTDLVKLSSREIANNMAREFRNSKTTSEQRKVIDGYGYSDIAGMMEYLGPIQKRKLRNVLKEEIASREVPDRAAFIGSLAGGLTRAEANALYDAMFADGQARRMKDLDVNELRTIQSSFDILDERRAELGERDPEVLSYFDENVAHYVKYGALIDKGTIGGRLGAFFNIGGRKVVRNKLVNSMKDYSMNVQDEKAAKTKYGNDIRQILGQEVVEVTDPANENRNRDAGYSNPTKDRARSGKSSTSKER